MSRHRTAATELAQSVARTAKEILDDGATQALASAGLLSARVVPFGADGVTNPTLDQIKSTSERLIQLAALEEFRDAEIQIQIIPRERIGRCVSGSAVSSRRFNLVDVHIRTIVRTRWVHPVAETEFPRQWIIA